MKGKRYIEVPVGPHHFRAKLVYEYRGNARVSLGSKEIIIRLPISLPDEEDRKMVKWAENYLKDLYQNRPDAFLKYINIDYREGHIISTFQGDITVSLIETKTENEFTARLDNEKLVLGIPPDCPTDDSVLGKLVEKIFRKHFLKVVYMKVLDLNEKHLREPFGKVNLRDNRTRWGSCSSSRNISIATRTLLAPEEVLDYIIIHELCHLREMNHSRAYWALVEKIDPDYKEKEEWLEKNGHLLRF
jgi:predicted metal-dependent hydrolase